MATKPKNAVVKKGESQVALFSEDMPDFLKGKDTARGSENVKTEDMIIPRLELVQSLSPCRKKNDPSYIEDAEEGDLYNNVTRKLYGESVVVVPVAFKKEFLLWKDRTQGGGFKGAYPSQAEAERAVKALGDEGRAVDIVDTAQNYCLLIDGDKVEEIVISMSKSKMKVSRRWNSMIRLNGGDRFSRAYRMSAVEDSSEKGDFYNLSVAPMGFVSEEVFAHAEKMYDAVMSGLATVDRGDDGSLSGDDDSDM